jgi:hypothetical protein
MEKHVSLLSTFVTSVLLDGQQNVDISYLEPSTNYSERNERFHFLLLRVFWMCWSNYDDPGADRC